MTFIICLCFYIAGMSILYLATHPDYLHITIHKNELRINERLIIAAMWPILGVAIVSGIITVGFILIPLIIGDMLDIRVSVTKRWPEEPAEEEDQHNGSVDILV